MSDQKYKISQLLLKSAGLIARDAVDRCPPNTYLNMAGILEREEHALSSRYGSIIINRDPVGSGTSNHLFTSEVVTLARLRGLNGTSYRYAALADGSLWRRTGDTQGSYTKILNAGTLSGTRFSTFVTRCPQSAVPFIFFNDSKAMYKDNGTGTPTRIGIFGPQIPISMLEYAPGVKVISNFLSTGSFVAAGGLSIGTEQVFQTFPGTFNGIFLGGNYYSYADVTLAFAKIPDGTLVTSTNIVNGQGLKFDSDPNLGIEYKYVDISGLGYATPTDTFKQNGFDCTIPASSVGTLTLADTLDLYNYNPADLVVLVMQVESPQNVSSISVQFDVGGSGYTTGYYTKTLIPVTYQGFLSNPLTTDPLTALADAVFAGTLTNPGTAPAAMPGPTSAAGQQAFAQQQIQHFNMAAYSLPEDPGGGSGGGGSDGSQPTQLASNNGWSVVYLQKGDFLPVGNAGQSGFDWSNITGFRISIATNTGGSTVINFNALYMQGTPTSSGVGTDAGASSFGGVGYDFRYTYYDANTGTESNPCSMQYFSETPVNPAGISTMTVLRQKIALTGQYSPDAQVTHVNIYARGGVYGNNWYYVDRIPNITTAPITESISFIQVVVDESGLYRNAILYTTNPNVLSNRAFVTITGLTTGTLLNGQRLPIASSGINYVEVFYADLATPLIAVTATPGTLTADATLGPNIFNYQYIVPDSALAQGNILKLANDVPFTSSLQTPINTTASVIAPLVGTFSGGITTVQTTNASAVFVPNQIVDIGNTSNLEQVVVIVGGTGTFSAWLQLPHSTGEPVLAFSTPAQPCNLSAVAYNQTWYAGDPNNPHFLYFTNPSLPENASPANYIPVGTPSNPIIIVVNFRGTLFVGTLGDTWYQIFPGNPPYAQVTGSKHGPVASFGWGGAEGEIWFASADGIRTFRGADGPYRSLSIEWLWRDNNLTPVPLVDTSQLSSIISAYVNNTAVFSYIGQDGVRHRLAYSSTYNRWRNDDVQVTAMYLESDTNTLVYAKPMTIDGTSGWAVVYDSYAQDYDDGGWVTGSLTQLPIPLNLQTPYLDLGTPNNQKQFNVLTIDANPNGQTITPVLLFDDNNGTVSPVTPTPSTFTGAVRDKFEFQVNAGFGQQAYRVSLKLTSNIVAAPILYQIDLYSQVLADWRASYDTYWVTLGATGESKLVKQAFFDYTTSGSPITVALYYDGLTTPYFTFTLPANPTRTGTPIRVRFPAQLLRQFRMVATSASKFQFWKPVQCEWKYQIGGGVPGQKSYYRSDLEDVTP